MTARTGTLDNPIGRRGNSRYTPDLSREFEHPEWMENAACAVRPDDDLWYPATSRAATVSQAKEICAGCPVLAQCRAHALTAVERWGIWGGLTENDRAQILRRRRAA